MPYLAGGLGVYVLDFWMGMLIFILGAINPTMLLWLLRQQVFQGNMQDIQLFYLALKETHTHTTYEMK